MSDYIGTRHQVDEYIGSRLVVAAYQGTHKYFDAYTEVTGILPIVFKSRVTVALKNYRIYGTENGAGVETENLFDGVFPEYVLNQTRYKQIAVPNGDYTLWTDAPKPNNLALFFLLSGYQTTGASTGNNGVWSGSPRTVNTQDGYVTLAMHPYTNYDPRNYKITLVPGSTAPASYIPPGYQIPLTNTSGVTENEVDPQDVQTVTINNNMRWGIPFILPAGSYTFKAFNSVPDSYIYAIIKHSDGSYSDISYVLAGDIVYTKTLTLVEGDTLYIYNAYVNGTQEQTISKLTDSHTMLVSGSTVPSEYIPHRYTADYNLYIGSTKLYEDEYVDYESGKIYRTINLITSDGKDFITADNNRFCVRRNNNG